MKKIVLFLFCLVPLLGLTAQPIESQRCLQVKVDTMEVRGDSMFLSMHLIQHGAVSGRHSFTLTPVFGDSSHWCELETIRVDGKKRKNSHWVLTGRKRGADTLHYSTSVFHEEWMDGATVTLRQTYAGRRPVVTRTVEFANWPLTPIYSAERLITLENYILPSPEGVKRRKTTGNAYLDFRVNDYSIDFDYRNNRKEMQRIYASISTIENNPDVRMTGIQINGFVSPEGLVRTSSELSQKRALALKNNIQYFFKLDSTLFEVEGKGENWDGLMELLQSNDNIRNDSVFTAICGDSVREKRQEAIRLLAGGLSYKSLLRKYFPDLRKVEYQIHYIVREYTFDESRQIYRREPYLLSQNELYLVAESFGHNSPAFDAVMEKMLELTPDDTTANINGAAVFLRRGETEMAGRCLMKCTGCPSAYNNLGAYYMQIGDLPTAEEYLLKAVSGGVPEATRNMLVLRAKKKMEQLKIQKGQKNEEL